MIWYSDFAEAKYDPALFWDWTEGQQGTLCTIGKSQDINVI